MDFFSALVTPRLYTTLRGEMESGEIDYNHFYEGGILQDYRYIVRGYVGYQTTRERSLQWNAVYRNPLQGLHLMASVRRRLVTMPYVSSRTFVDGYVILSSEELETKRKAWNATLMAQKGWSWLNTKWTLLSNYNQTDYQVAQDGTLCPVKSRLATVNSSLELSPWKGASLKYAFAFARNEMEIRSLDAYSGLNSWTHALRANVIIGKWALEGKVEYDHNQLSPGQYKDCFFADASIMFRAKRCECKLSVTNILNKDSYAYSVSTDLLTSVSKNQIRGRELLLTIYYKP